MMIILNIISYERHAISNMHQFIPHVSKKACFMCTGSGGKLISLHFYQKWIIIKAWFSGQSLCIWSEDSRYGQFMWSWQNTLNIEKVITVIVRISRLASVFDPSIWMLVRIYFSLQIAVASIAKTDGVDEAPIWHATGTGALFV